MNIAIAKHRYARISATKVRLVARMISGKNVDSALDVLNFDKRKGSVLLKKVLNSAIANAENNQGLNIDNLVVSTIFVDEGPTMKRFRARARGRSSKILKRTSHITVEVKETE